MAASARAISVRCARLVGAAHALVVVVVKVRRALPRAVVLIDGPLGRVRSIRRRVRAAHT